jgi:hypothetical protein
MPRSKVVELARIAGKVKRTPAELTALRTAVADPAVADALAARADALLYDDQPRALRIFDVVLDCPALPTPRYYNNALFCMHLAAPVDAALRERFLARTLPHAKAYPAIAYNAALVLLDAGDTDAALAQLAEAVTLGYAAFDDIRIAFAAHADDPRLRKILPKRKRR